MHWILLLVLLGVGNIVTAQNNQFDPEDFAFAGDAVPAGERCFQLTDAFRWQGGSIWFKKQVDLNDAFSIEFDIFLGCNDENGADGIVFILHPELTTGYAGEGMGFGGLFPSFGVEMDTYRNYHLDDPGYDHAAFMAHGYLNHAYGITDPITLANGKNNLEDCNFHKVKIEWNPISMYVKFYFDGSLRIDKRIDLVADLFDGNSNVYWGFTAATGDKYNNQKICMERLIFTEPFSLSKSVVQQLSSGQPYTMETLDFAAGSTQIPQAALGELDKLVKFFKENSRYSVVIDGFTDSSGKKQNNLRLSKLRAKAIADYFRTQGIDPERLLYFGNGEANPVAPNDTSLGRKKNRRIQLQMRIIGA
jgi:hypothetical protein